MESRNCSRTRHWYGAKKHSRLHVDNIWRSHVSCEQDTSKLLYVAPSTQTHTPDLETNIPPAAQPPDPHQSRMPDEQR